MDLGVAQYTMYTGLICTGFAHERSARLLSRHDQPREHVFILPDGSECDITGM